MTDAPDPFRPWERRDREPEAPLRGEASARVVIIGGGFTGLGAAWTLAREVEGVVVVEAEQLASGATGASAGMVLPGTSEYPSRWPIFLGPDATPALLRLARANRDLVLEALEETAISCGARVCDGHRFALSPRELKEMEASIPLYASHGHEVELIDAELARELTGSRLFRGGLRIAEEIFLDPVAFVEGLGRVLADRVRIHEHTPVVRIAQGRDGTLSVHTDRGVLRTDMVLVTVNAQVRKLIRGYEDRVMGLRGQALLVQGDGSVSRVDGLTNFGNEYWRVLPGDRFLLGGARESSEKTEWGFDTETGPQVQGALERFLGTAFPDLAGAEILGRWAGTTAITCDEIPIIGALPGQAGILIAVGFGGRGLSLGFAAGERLARLVLEGRYPDQEWLAPRRFG